MVDYKTHFYGDALAEYFPILDENLIVASFNKKTMAQSFQGFTQRCIESIPGLFLVNSSSSDVDFSVGGVLFDISLYLDKIANSCYAKESSFSLTLGCTHNRNVVNLSFDCGLSSLSLLQGESLFKK